MSLSLCVWDVFLHVFVVDCGKSLDSGICCYAWDILESCLCYFSGFLSLLLLWIHVFVTSLDSSLLLLWIHVFVGVSVGRLWSVD